MNKKRLEPGTTNGEGLRKVVLSVSLQGRRPRSKEVRRKNPLSYKKIVQRIGRFYIGE